MVFLNSLVLHFFFIFLGLWGRCGGVGYIRNSPDSEPVLVQIDSPATPTAHCEKHGPNFSPFRKGLAPKIVRAQRTKDVSLASLGPIAGQWRAATTTLLLFLLLQIADWELQRGRSVHSTQQASSHEGIAIPPGRFRSPAARPHRRFAGKQSTLLFFPLQFVHNVPPHVLFARAFIVSALHSPWLA